MARRTLLVLAMVVIGSIPTFAQLAVETAPGVRFYGGDTMSVETLPGYHRFSGAVEGSAVQTMPGVTYYNLRPRLGAELEQSFEAESRWRAHNEAEWGRIQREEHRRDRELSDRIGR